MGQTVRDTFKNLLTMTHAFLSAQNLTPEDVQWVGSKDGRYAMTWAEFEAIADFEFCLMDFVDSELVLVGAGWFATLIDPWREQFWEITQFPVQQLGAQPFVFEIAPDHAYKRYEIKEAPTPSRRGNHRRGEPGAMPGFLLPSGLPDVVEQYITTHDQQPEGDDRLSDLIGGEREVRDVGQDDCRDSSHQRHHELTILVPGCFHYAASFLTSGNTASISFWSSVMRLLKLRVSLDRSLT